MIPDSNLYVWLFIWKKGLPLDLGVNNYVDDAEGSTVDESRVFWENFTLKYVLKLKQKNFDFNFSRGRNFAIYLFSGVENGNVSSRARLPAESCVVDYYDVIAHLFETVTS